MKKALIMAALAACSLHAAAQTTAKGVVFHDANGNGSRDAGEVGVEGVGVSNGEAVVATGADGAYILPVTDDTILFVIKPSGWRVHSQPRTNIPAFYYVHKPDGSPDLEYKTLGPTGPLPESVDFALMPQDESKPFNMLCLGDTQPRDQTDVDFLSHDTVEELIGVDALFGVTLGDIVFDNLNMHDEIAQGIGLIGLPWHHVIGNHDLNYDAPDRKRTDESYERVFGPAWYSFNYGKVHFLSLNSVYWDVEKDEYHGEFSEDQLAFIKNDLALVPKDYLIVPMMHIPLDSVSDRAKLFEMLDDFPHTLSLAAHWHRQEHFFMDGEQDWHGAEPHHHFVSNTACGSWLTGQFDELGLPEATMSDGAPNGHTIIRFDGVKYTMTYKAARRPADYQMNIHTPEFVSRTGGAKAAVSVNVFNGSEKSTVEMRLTGTDAWTPLAQTRGFDPYFEAAYARQQDLLMQITNLVLKEEGDREAQFDQIRRAFRPHIRTLPTPRETNHLWKADLDLSGVEPGYHLIEVRTKDMFGQEYTDHRVIRVVE